MKATVVIPYVSHLQAEQELAELIPLHPNTPERTQTNNRTHAVAFLSIPHKHITNNVHIFFLHRLMVLKAFWQLKLHQLEVHRSALIKNMLYTVELLVVSYSINVSASGVSPACLQILQSLPPF